jgi:hypothetical protein
MSKALRGDLLTTTLSDIASACQSGIVEALQQQWTAMQKKLKTRRAELDRILMDHQIDEGEAESAAAAFVAAKLPNRNAHQQRFEPDAWKVSLPYLYLVCLVFVFGLSGPVFGLSGPLSLCRVVLNFGCCVGCSCEAHSSDRSNGPGGAGRGWRRRQTGSLADSC